MKESTPGCGAPTPRPGAITETNDRPLKASHHSLWWQALKVCGLRQPARVGVLAFNDTENER